MHRKARSGMGVGLAAALLVLTLGVHDRMALADSEPTVQETQTQMMFFRSYPQDAKNCQVVVKDGEVTYPGIGAPAATCPDAYAWNAFMNTIQSRFWTWAMDTTVWPDEPLPLCAKAGDKDCCDPSLLDAAKPFQGAPNEHCPYSPADYANPPVLKVEQANNHSPTFVNHLNPARQLRDEEVELIYRNESLMRSIFEQNLYSKEGLGARFRALNTALESSPPYHPEMLEVYFPTDSTMAKADWVHERFMLAKGLITDKGPKGEKLDPPQNPEFPYVTVWMEGKDPADTGYYYLVAMTNASKVLPSWHWYAIEHVANLGRCDYLGCNDSFGYLTPGKTMDGVQIGRNYIPPNPLGDPVPDNDPAPDFPSGYGLTYLPAETGEAMTEQLKALMQHYGVATAAVDADPKTLDPSDPAWANYRLKGSQTQFATRDGVANLMGASVTEGGFVNSASCMTCHSTATTDEYGNPGMASVGSISRMNLLGFTEGVTGPPQEAWFFNFGSPIYNAMPLDYVWGILNAECIKDATDPAQKAKGRCESYDNMVLTWPGK